MLPRKRPGKRKRASSDVDPVERSLLERLEELKKPNLADEAEIFGNHVAARLRTFTPRQYAITCLKIEQLLVDAQYPLTPCNTNPSQSTYNVSAYNNPSTPSADYYNF